MKSNDKQHREFLIRMYDGDVKVGTAFEKVVASQALRYLLHTDIKPKKIEKWACDLSNKFKQGVS